mmetsp:Transcript_6943/g.10590  ORF Transcript_6943/g.10590 Transcript_6943/m.10590 type:complete len:263 (+) Transcript_6943:101-889(+)
MKLSSCLTLTSLVFVARTANYECDGFSPAITNNIPSIFKRASLKKELIKAASTKDESKVLSLVEELSQFNPTAVPTSGLMGYGGSGVAPLNGKWKLLYTNAQDAEAPARTEKNKDEKFGDEVATGVKVKTGQRINAENGECINYIQLSEENDDANDDVNNPKKRKRPFDELEITIQMTPLSDNRVRLDFVKGKALNENAPLPFLKEFNFNFPPPSFGDLLARIRGLDPKIEPQAYFDILYIDNEIRAHRTGEGKIFVQKRDK